MDADNHSVKRISGDSRPMWLGALEQLRQMWLQAIPSSVFTIDTVISLLHCQEVVMHIFEVIEHIAQAHILRMVADLFFVRSAILFSLFHAVSCIMSLTPNQWVGPTRHQEVTLVMPVQWVDLTGQEQH